jgi:hypothetical protein
MFLKLDSADVAVALGSAFLGGVAGATLLPLGSSRIEYGVVGTTIAVATYLLTSPFIYRGFRLRPMRYPACPRCAATDGPWGIATEKPARSEALVCGHCGGVTTFWYRTPSPGEHWSSPAFVLRWYLPFGIWRALKRRPAHAPGDA